MQAISGMLELFGRITGLRDPKIPLPAHSPLAGGLIPPPVVPQAAPAVQQALPFTEATAAAAVTEVLPPVVAVGITELPGGEEISIASGEDDPVTMTHDEAHFILRALADYYGFTLVPKP